VADPVLTDILVPTKAAIAAIGPNMAKIILGALVALLILAVLVATGHINQKGPHGRRGHSDRVRSGKNFWGARETPGSAVTG